HPLAGRSLLARVLGTVAQSGVTATAVVIGPGEEAVAAEVKRVCPDAECFVQHERCGTAHAVLAARAAIERGADDILIVYGDTPLIAPASLSRLRAAIARGAAVAVLGLRATDSSGYGRLIVDKGELVAIREDADASASERKTALCNGGTMALAGKTAPAILERIGDENRKHEFYLTDAVEIARGMALSAVAVEVEEDEMRGINTKKQL